MKNTQAKYSDSTDKSPWGKAIMFFVLLILGDYLCLRFAFAMDATRFIGLLGFIVGLYSLFHFSIKLAGLFIHRNLQYSEVTSVEAQKDKQITKGTYLSLFFILVLLGSHIYGYHRFINSQVEQLEKNGIPIRTVVTKKTREYREKNSPAQHYIYYTYRYKNKDYHQNSASELYEVGDTITVKLLPSNPDNHRIIESK